MGLTLAAELINREIMVEAVVIGDDSQATIQAMKSIYGTPSHHLVDSLDNKVEEVHK